MPPALAEPVPFCGLPDHIIGQAAGQLCRLRNFRFTWCVVDGLPGVEDSLLIATYTAAWDSWAKRVGIQPVYSEDARTADILIGSRVIDGTGGVLAEAQLPCGNYPQQLRSWFDTSEAWIVVGGTPMRRGIPLYLTAAHEFGHHLGMGHSRVPSALMAPTLNTSLDGPQENDDLQEGRARYGPAVILPFPTTPPPTLTTTTSPPWIPTTPPPTIPGGSMTRDELRTQLAGIIGTVGFIARWTPTTADDKIVALLTAALSQDWLLDLLLGVLNKVPANATNEQVVAALREGMADETFLAALKQE